jgi:pantothenate kinase
MNHMIDPLSPAAHDRIRTLLKSGGRRLLGIAGSPGSGKSTIAAAIAKAYPDDAVVVPMDGFHLAQMELERLGRASRKGAPDTFDARGYAALLQRIRTETDATVYGPYFAREIEEPIANAIPVEPDRRLIVTEGNYLLFDGAWARIRTLLDETWFVATDPIQRDAWLLARHIAFGRTPDAARAWIDTTDAPNALLIDATRARADWTVC